MGLFSYAVKFKRACEHLDSLKSEVSWWVNTEPYGVVDEPDPKPPPEFITHGGIARRFRVNRVSAVPDRFSVLIGDCVFNLRSALDHIALALAQANTPGLSAKRVAASQFPIFAAKDGRSGYAQDRERRIGAIATDAKLVIDSLQPYHRGDGYKLHPLWQIHELNCIDKHRELTVCAAVSSDRGQRVVSWTKTGRENVASFPYFISAGGVYELNAVFAMWSGVPIDPNQEICLKPQATVEIAFGNGSVASGQPVIPLLESLCDFVMTGVLHPLVRFLPT